MLGCALFGGLGSLPDLRDRGISHGVAFELMDAAWEMGIRRFDTADAYGGGLSEQWIGEWTSVTGHPVHVTTKTFNAMTDGADTGLSPQRIRRQLDSSLERLGRNSVDLYLAHEWDPDVPAEATIETFEELVDAGKLVAYGYSNISTDQLRSIGSEGTLSAVQNSYSLLRRIDEETLMPECSRAGIDYEAYSPLAGGWLTGKYRAGEPPPPDSRMALVPEWYTHVDPTTAARASDAFAARASDMGVSPAGLALAWVLASPSVARVMVGPKRLEHLEPVREAMSVRLSSDERAQIGALFAG